MYLTDLFRGIFTEVFGSFSGTKQYNRIFIFIKVSQWGFLALQGFARLVSCDM